MEEYTMEDWLAASQRLAASGDMEGAAQAAAMAQALSLVKDQNPSAWAMPRAVAQGVTMGGSDELEGMVRNPTEVPSYLTGGDAPGIEETRDEVLGDLDNFDSNNPVSGMLLRGAGAVATSAVGGPTQTLRSLMARGAGEGAATGFLTGDGDITDRTVRGAVGGVGGAVLGPAVGGATAVAGKAIRGSLRGLTDFVRKRYGGTGSTFVTSEIRRIADRAGLTPDEVVDRIRQGEVFAEMSDTTRALTRTWTADPDANRTISEGLDGRAQALRGAAGERIGRDLAGTPGNVRAQLEMDDEAAVAEVDRLFNKAWPTAGGGPGNDRVITELQDVLRASPQTAADVETAIRASTRGRGEPFFQMVDGEPTFIRPPTIQEAEVVRRALQENVNTAWKGGKGTIGKPLGDMEKTLRTAIDTQSGAVKSARAASNELKDGREAIQAGRDLLNNKDIDGAVLLWEGATDAQRTNMRAGFVDRLRKEVGTRSGIALMRDLEDETTQRGQLLRLVYPPDELPGVLDYLRRANNAQSAKSEILGGSKTFQSTGMAQTQGESVGNIVNNAVDASRGGIGGIVGIVQAIGRQMGRKTSPEEAAEIGRILTSSDPDLVERALNDPMALRALQEPIVYLLNAKRGGQLGGRVGGLLGGESASLLGGEPTGAW